MHDTGIMRGRPDLRLNVETNPYEVQDYLAKFRRSKSAMIIKGSHTVRWSSLPQRKSLTVVREPRKIQTVYSSDEDDEDELGLESSLDISSSPLTSRSKVKDQPKVTNSVGFIESPPPVCPTKYFPYRRSGYLDHMVRQSRVNSARVLMSENPDFAAPLRAKSAQLTVVPAAKVMMPARAKTAEFVRQPQVQNSRRRQEITLKKVEIRDTGMTGAVKTREYTSDIRNVYYTRRPQQEVARDTVKAVRFDGGFQDAIISPRQNEFVALQSPEPEEPPPKSDATLKRDIIVEYQPPMDTSVSKETNHIPFNIYRSADGRTAQPSVSRNMRKDVDDYDYKTDKVLSYYLQQERRPGTAKFDFTAQNKLYVRQDSKSASKYRPRMKIPVNESHGQSDIPRSQPKLGGGFLKIHKRLVLHQRPVEEDQNTGQDVKSDDKHQVKHSHSSNKRQKPPIDPTNLCLLCNCSNSDNWRVVDAMLSRSSARDLTLPALNKTMKR